MEIKAKMRAFIFETALLGSSEESLKNDDSFLEKGIIDSTGILELVAFVEEEFGIEVKDEELIPDNFDSVDKITEYIAKKAQS
jgi:acyl carrier protein